MGKQYKELKDNDIEFIKKQKLFYLASCSDKEVNLSPKGYDTIMVLDNSTILFMNYPGSGNRTYRDAVNEGEFTLVFNSFEKEARILRLFCKAIAVDETNEKFKEYAKLFGEDPDAIRNFFEFSIYAVESSCGLSVPYMEYKGERGDLKEWARKMSKSDKLKEYKEKHFTPVDLKKI